MRVPPELLHKIKEAVNIVDIVGEHVVLRKSGANYTGLCPFHSERSPSFSVSENKQLYHCYGCKKGGDLISFVSEIHGLDFIEAVEELAERARIPLPRGWGDDGAAGPGNEDPQAKKRREEARQKLQTAFRLNRFVAAFYHQQLSSNPEALRYFRKRGVNEDLIRSFYLGAAPASWDSLAGFLSAKKAPLPLAVDLGLIRPSTKGSSSSTGYFDLFRNRVMFPILDLRGRVAGFGGRLPPDSDEKPKYLNSPDSLTFQKGKLAFGLYQAQKHIRETGVVILVEGYFDVLALHAAGFSNAVACGGTALTVDHLNLFRRFADKVILLFDGDKAGIAATERAMELGLEQGMILNGAVMPADLDPDEVLFNPETGEPASDGKEKMRAILEAAQPLIDARIEEAIGRAATSPETRSQAVKQIAGWLKKLKDPVGREVRLQHVQNALQLPRNLLLQAMGMGGQQQAMPPAASARPLSKTKTPVKDRSQSSSLNSNSLSNGDKALLWAFARIHGESREAKDLAALVEKARVSLPPEAGIGDLFDYRPARDQLSQLSLEVLTPALLSDPRFSGLDSQLRSTLTEAWVGGETQAKPLGLEDVRAAFDRAISRSWARFSHRIKRALADAEAKKDAGLQAQLMKEYLDVQRKMKEFNSFYDEA